MHDQSPPRAHAAINLSHHLWRAPPRIAKLCQEPLIVAMVLGCQSRGLPVRQNEAKPSEGQDEVSLRYLVCDGLFSESRPVLNVLI